eukprot:5281682-Prymnesium_polylepis.1
MLPPGVEKTTGGAGGERHAAREGANGTRTADDCGDRRGEARVANTEGPPSRHSGGRVICESGATLS